MKHLLPLILLCLLLCGCGQTAPPEETTAPPVTASEGMYEPGGDQGGIQIYPLDIPDVRGMKTLEDNLLLISGQGSTELTLLSPEDLTILASVSLSAALDPDAPSLRVHPGGALSFYDPESEETVVLDGSLRELRRIAAPGTLTGEPILSDDGRILYYCTASDVRAWDLESGIRRRIKEMSFDSQELTGILLEGSVLQCHVLDVDTERTLFFSSENGQLLYEGTGTFRVLSQEDRYYANFPAGTLGIPIFGRTDSEPQMLVPAQLESESFFLPRLNGLVSARASETQLALEYYDLSTGLRPASLTLSGFQSPTAVESIGETVLYILTHNPAQNRDFLCRWEVGGESPDDTCYTSPWYSSNAPDTTGLALCQAYADRIGKRFGINILIWKDAAAAAPWDYTVTPEHLVPVLQEELELLEKRLSRYPEGLLSQTAGHFTSLNLCIVRSLTGTGQSALNTATGVQFLDGSDAYVVIAAGEFSEQALYHELFHVMETHIFAESTAFDRWEELNPAGFQYDYSYAANAVRDSGVYLQSENRAFVDTYSMSFPKEDRARIMEYAMLPGYEDLFRSEKMQSKLRTLCTGIREAYGLEDSGETLLWEQYLEK